MKKSKQVYLNVKQSEFLRSKQPVKVFLGGRGSGKSSVIGPDTYIKMKYLPRSKGFFSSTTYNQILTKTLPAIEGMWNRLGLVEDVHYVVGKRPPRNFVKPYSPPRKFENVITFWNGLTIEFLSTDRQDLIRGGSYDWGEIDEAALIAHEKFTKVLLPMIRGNVHRFRHWSHHQVSLYTSMPWKSTGFWILDYEQKALELPEEYCWIEASAFDNIHVLGEKGLKRLEREMSYLEYQVEVMNHRIKKLPDGFYHAFDDTVHTYTPGFDYGVGSRGIEVKGREKHYDYDAEIDLSFDFSGWFNGCTVWQTQGEVDRCIDLFWVKNEQKISKLIANFLNAYKGHSMKRVNLYGEPRGHDKNPLGDSIYNQIRVLFIDAGWECVVKVENGQALSHLKRHYFVNDILEEENAALPQVRINEEKCKDLIIALQLTQITKDFKKNKSKEKDREFPQEHAPHLTDTLDYILVQKHYWKVVDEFYDGTGSVSFL